MPDNKRTAAADYAPSRPPDEPCLICGRPWNAGKHHEKPPPGTKCGLGGCKAALLERCTVAGVVTGCRCLGGGHTQRF